MAIDILSLGTYPISRPIHGGQRRVSALHEVYRKSGINSTYIGIYSQGSYPQTSKEELRFSLSLADHERFFNVAGRRQDIDMPMIFSHRPALLDAVREEIQNLQPRIIQFEQPWLFHLVSLLEGCLSGKRLVYSSQNVESGLESRSAVRQRIDALERKIVARADLIVACTEGDAAIYRDWGAREVVVAGNGCHAPAPVDGAKAAYWRDALKGRRFVFYAASAHPPNARGFLDMLGPIPGCVPPDGLIVVAGEVDRIIRAAPDYAANAGVFEETTRLTGVIPDADLAALAGAAEAFILPITAGGGSNLKTAEALLSLKPMIATSISLRSFESYATASGVHVADEPEAFKRLVRECLTDGLHSRRTTKDVEGVLWSFQLAPAVGAIKRLLARE